MPTYRFQVAALADSALPRDRIVNTVHLRDTDLGPLDESGLGNLCGDMAAVFNDRVYFTGGAREIKVTCYPVGPPPNAPITSRTIGTGLAPASGLMRELALCLSYRGDTNTPRTRGRLYIPQFGAQSPTPVNVRPTQAQREWVLGLAPLLADLGGVDVDWVVYSATTGQSHPVQHAWVDDEWDIVRSRGLRGAERSTQALSE